MIAISEGTAVITASSANGVKATCNVTVDARVIEVSSIVLNADALTLTEGDTYQLTASIDPEDATDKTLTWTSSDEGVATVSAGGIVTATGIGQAEISASALNGVKGICNVTVEARIIEMTSISLNAESLALEVG
ncbi:MAG: Ig-like domain-containing protein, partial [Muribaculaceae bacterium]|nr:Ig-like domain-containing protein [Muribaculaceae bacterium]